MTTFSSQATAESEIIQAVFRVFSLASAGTGPIGTGPVER